MKLLVSLVVLCLSGAVSARSVQDLESDLLQAIREIAEDPPQGEDNSVKPVPPNTEEEETSPGGDDGMEDVPPFTEEEETSPDGDDAMEDVPPFTEEEEAAPGGDNIIDSMPPDTEEEAAPGEGNAMERVPPLPAGEQSDAVEDTGGGDYDTDPSLAEEESLQEEDGNPDNALEEQEEEEDQQAAMARSVQDLESELLQAIREIAEDQEAKINKVQDVTMKVSYKGETSEERVSFDDDTGSETIQVSARAGMGETNIRHCFKEGMSLECLPASGKCFLLSIASEGEPGLQRQKEDMAKFLEKSPSGEVSADDAPEVTINWVVKEKVSRGDLPACLADFRPDLPVFSAVKAPEDEATVTDDRQDAGQAGEEKRSWTSGSQQCAHSACPIRKRVQKQGNCYYNYCYRQYICSTFCVECVCCPEVTQASRCLICRD